MIKSAFETSFFIRLSSRQSPRATWKFANWQQSSKVPWRNRKLSKTVTSWPSASSVGVNTEPIYPAPPVIKILIQGVQFAVNSPQLQLRSRLGNEILKTRL